MIDLIDGWKEIWKVGGGEVMLVAGRYIDVINLRFAHTNDLLHYSRSAAPAVKYC